MSNVHSVIQQAEQRCKTHHTRLTVKRKQVLNGIIQSNKALPAYGLTDFCKEHRFLQRTLWSRYIRDVDLSYFRVSGR